MLSRRLRRRAMRLVRKYTDSEFRSARKTAQECGEEFSRLHAEIPALNESIRASEGDDAAINLRKLASNYKESSEILVRWAEAIEKAQKIVAE